MRARSTDRTDSADGAFAIQPDDNVDLVRLPIAINVRTTGVVAFIGADGNSADVYVAAGVVFPLRCRRVLATGTTATGIRGLV